MYGSNCVWFQSTLPQGKWQYGKSKNRRALWFQSTLPQGKWLYNITDRTKMELFQSTLPQGKWRGEMDYSQFRAYFNHTSAREVTKCKQYRRINSLFQSTLPQGKWQQYSTKTSVYFYEISINIFEFTFVYYWNTLSIQKAHSNLFIFTGASLPVILCMLDTRTCKL